MLEMWGGQHPRPVWRLQAEDYITNLQLTVLDTRIP